MEIDTEDSAGEAIKVPARIELLKHALGVIVMKDAIGAIVMKDVSPGGADASDVINEGEGTRLRKIVVT